jgi:hypothetical protein
MLCLVSCELSETCILSIVIDMDELATCIRRIRPFFAASGRFSNYRQGMIIDLS